MALVVVAYPDKNIGGKVVNNSILANWSLQNGDVGEKVKSAEFADKTVHFLGDFGAGGSVRMRGSNKIDADETVDSDWFIVTDGASIAVEKTSAGGSVILENTLWVSPECTAGDGSTLIQCSLLAKKDD